MNKIAIEFWIENDILNVVFHNESVTFEEVDYAIKKRLELAAGKSFLFFLMQEK